VDQGRVVAVPATDDRWDVVVVGLRDPSQAAAKMAVAELAHYASLPPQDVERMLEEGEVPVLENLDRAEAERAAMELAELGVLIDLRLAVTESGVFPVFKPDAERQIGVAVGGLIDDSATPPSVGESLGVPELEPDLEAPQEPRSRPVSSAAREARASARGGLSVRQGGRGSEAARREEPTPPPRPSHPGSPRARAPTPSPSREPSQSTRAATPKAGRSEPGDAAGARARAGGPGRGEPSIAPRKAEALLGDIGPSAPAPKLPERLQRATAAAHKGQGEIELDFAAAGVAPPPKRGAMATPAPVVVPMAERSASRMPRRTRAGKMGGTGVSAAGYAQDDSGVLEVLRNDGVAALLMGLGLGLALSLLLALQMQRSSARERLPPLEEEFAAALNDPAGVASGKQRDPSAVEGEIEEVLGEIQRSFLLWWLLPGLGVGLVLARLRAG
jgi:hypothetical protein